MPLPDVSNDSVEIAHSHCSPQRYPPNHEEDKEKERLMKMNDDPTPRKSDIIHQPRSADDSANGRRQSTGKMYDLRKSIENSGESSS